MANAMYTLGREHILLGDVAWLTADIKVVSVDETDDAPVLATDEFLDPLRRRIAEGLPVLGTCAGMIFLATSTTGPDQPQLGVLDAVVERNAFGRQVDSFEMALDVTGLDGPIHAVFIRAPWIDKVGGSVEVLATVADPETGRDRPVVVRQDNIVATSFHPELTADGRLHELFLGDA